MGKRNPILMSEAEFTSAVIQAAQAFGWIVAHFRPAKTEKGWRTAVQGDGKGYPDLTLVHPKWRRVVIAELKAEKGKVAPEQHRWLEAFAEAGIETHVWRPSDWDALERVLSTRRAA